MNANLVFLLLFLELLLLLELLLVSLQFRFGAGG